MLDELLASGNDAQQQAPPPGSDAYLAYCAELAARLGKHWDRVLDASAADIAAARARELPEAIIDRLTLSERHLGQLVALAGEVAELLPAVTGQGPSRPGTRSTSVRRIPKPIGLILMIYEARPTVTVEGALLPVAVGNSVILRGGSEIANTARALGEIVAEALLAAGLPAGLAQVLTDSDRRLVRELLKRPDAIDALIPRGGPSLIDYCLRSSTIPVIASGGGVNHLYVDRAADLELAAAIVLDSKIAEPTACNTLEMVLAHAEIAGPLVAGIIRVGERTRQTCRLRVDPSLLPVPGAGGPVVVEPLGEHDDGREFLDKTVGLRPIPGIEAAIAHIRRYGSRHTEGVVAGDPQVLQRFLGGVDAAALVVNSSLRLHDGPSMCLGPELSISTGRLHVRGPVGLSSLLSYSWVIEGDGSLRGDPEEQP